MPRLSRCRASRSGGGRQGRIRHARCRTSAASPRPLHRAPHWTWRRTWRLRRRKSTSRLAEPYLAEPEADEGGHRDERAEALVGGAEDGGQLLDGGQRRRSLSSPHAGQGHAVARISSDELVSHGCSHDGPYIVEAGADRAGRLRNSGSLATPVTTRGRKLLVRQGFPYPGRLSHTAVPMKRPRRLRRICRRNARQDSNRPGSSRRVG